MIEDMVPYLAIAVSRVDPGWLLSGQTPRHEVTATLAEYKYLAESIAAQYGSIHSSFGDNGHLLIPSCVRHGPSTADAA